MTLVKKAAQTAPAPAPALPVHEQVYQNLRERILFGEIAPGQAVTIKGLTEAIGAGVTPVREAIRRLTSDGALRFQDNRRVIVPSLTEDEMEQIVFLRKSVECDLTRRAASQILPRDLAMLRQIDADLDAAIVRGDVAQYLQLNYRFHQLLYELARAPILAGLASRLWLRFGPSLRVVCGRIGTENLPDRHKDLLHALGQADADAAATAMAQDIDQGMQQVAAVFHRPG